MITAAAEGEVAIMEEEGCVHVNKVDPFEDRRGRLATFTR